jgi:hypothetical protein
MMPNDRFGRTPAGPSRKQPDWSIQSAPIALAYPIDFDNQLDDIDCRH